MKDVDALPPFALTGKTVGPTLESTVQQLAETTQAVAARLEALGRAQAEISAVS
jgi:hypothetical protein